MSKYNNIIFPWVNNEPNHNNIHRRYLNNSEFPFIWIDCYLTTSKLWFWACRDGHKNKADTLEIAMSEADTYLRDRYEKEYIIADERTRCML